MTASDVVQPTTAAPRKRPQGAVLASWLSTTDHKVIGYLYLVTVVRLLPGRPASWRMLIRAELSLPGLQLVNNEKYNQLFTVHGTIMLLLFATPAVRRVRQPRHAAADRRPRCGVPAAEHVQLLAVPVRRPHRPPRIRHPAEVRRASAGSPTRR